MRARNTVVVWMVFCLSVQGQTDIRQKNYNSRKGITMEGYDPVSYFDGQPLEGKSAIYFTYSGITYRFATEANLRRFKAMPDKYEPAFGGWCAFAMGDTGEKVKIDPNTYKVIDGRLYLFYNFWGNNTLIDWNKNEPGLKAKGEQNWRKFVP